jgi:hypothetical protein
MPRLSNGQKWVASEGRPGWQVDPLLLTLADASTLVWSKSDSVVFGALGQDFPDSALSGIA